MNCYSMSSHDTSTIMIDAALPRQALLPLLSLALLRGHTGHHHRHTTHRIHQGRFLLPSADAWAPKSVPTIAGSIPLLTL